MFAGGKLFTVPMAVEDIGSDAYTNGIETLEALTGSAVRLRVLGLLLERGSVTASDIEPNVDVSRRTVTRALSALEEQQFAASKQLGRWACRLGANRPLLTDCQPTARAWRVIA